MRVVQGESRSAAAQAELFFYAEQLVDSPDQIDRYDRAKWNLLGHADRGMRFQGHHPWPKRIDDRGVERTLSVPVFSGFSEETESVLVVRKDPWTHQNDPASWLVAEQNLTTGVYIEPQILSANVDAARQLWLQLAPRNYSNWPPGKHPALHSLRRDQIRLTGRMDNDYHLMTAEYHEGMGGRCIEYEDIEALESMIIVVQQLRRAAEEEVSRAEQQRTRDVLLGVHGIAYADDLLLAS